MKIKYFKSAHDFRRWLEKNHATMQDCWVGYYKKSSRQPSMTWPESVDEALCFGWIDGIRKSVVGIALICVPVVALLVFLKVGYIPLQPFAVTLMIGTYGAWMLLKGAIMFLAPKSEPGDVAEQ